MVFLGELKFTFTKTEVNSIQTDFLRFLVAFLFFLSFVSICLINHFLAQNHEDILYYHLNAVLFYLLKLIFVWCEMVSSFVFSHVCPVVQAPFIKKTWPFSMLCNVTFLVKCFYVHKSISVLSALFHQLF